MGRICSAHRATLLRRRVDTPVFSACQRLLSRAGDLAQGGGGGSAIRALRCSIPYPLKCPPSPFSWALQNCFDPETDSLPVEGGLMPSNLIASAPPNHGTLAL